MVLFIAEKTHSQTLDWVITSNDGGSFGEADVQQNMSSNSNSDIFLCGSYYGTINGDADPTVNNLPVTDLEHFIQKFTSGGVLDWTYLVHVEQNSIIDFVEIEATPDGGVALIGQFSGIVDFDFGGNGFIDTSSAFGTNNQLQDLFVLKIGATGNFEWVNVYGTQAYTNYPQMAILPNGNIAFCFWLQDSIDINPNGASNIQYPASYTSNNYSIVGLSANGSVIWSSKLELFEDTNNPVFLELNSLIASDNSNEFFLSYKGKGCIQYNRSAAAPTNCLNGTGANSFSLIKLSGSGIFQQSQHYENFNVFNFGITLTGSNKGEPVLTGTYRGTFDFDPDGSIFNMTSEDPDRFCYFIVKLDNNLAFKNALSGPNYFTFVDTRINSSGIYLRSQAEFGIDFNFGSGTDSIHGNTLQPRVAIARLDSNLNYQSIYSYSLDHANYYTSSWFVDESQAYYSEGRYFDTYDFSPGSSVNSIACLDSSSTFLLKLDLNQAPNGIKTNEMPEQIHANVFPNPSSGTWFVETKAFDRSLTVELFDLTGKKIQSNQEINNDLISIRADVPAGIYLLKLSDENGIIALKKLVRN